MADPIKINGQDTLAQLASRLLDIEGAFTAVKELTNDGRDTIAKVEDVDAVPAPLSLVLDPAGNQPAPAGKTVVCRGEVMIQGFKQKVAAFR